jgi:UDP-N-acetylmuramate--alanine ligase
VIVVDDYGHHPTEIKTTLQAARSSWPDHRLMVVFQPHRYSRTKALFDDFTRAFYQSDSLVLLPIYSAGEAPVPDCPSSEDLCDGIRAHGHRDVLCRDDFPSALSHLKSLLGPAAPPTVLLTLGAGDVYKIGEAFLED